MTGVETLSEQRVAAVELDQPAAAEQIAGDSLFWYARAVYRCRWFCVLLLLSGTGYGLWLGLQQPLFRTVAVLRVVNPLVGYHHRSYWEPQGRIAQSQVRMAAESLLSRGLFNLKAESDPWVMRLEVQHQVTGSGQQSVQDVLNKLSDVGARAAPAAAEGTPAGTLQTVAIADVLDQLQQVLRLLRAERGLPPLDLSQTATAVAGQRYASDVMLRMPFDELPMAGRFRQLQLAVDRYFAEVAGIASDGVRTADELKLLQLQSQVMRQMLINWGRMDLFAAAVTENTVQADLVYETCESRIRVIAREALLWTMIVAGAAILVVVPVIWTSDHWLLIRQHCNPQRPCRTV